MMGHRDMSEHACAYDYAKKHKQYHAKSGTRKWAKRIANRIVRRKDINCEKDEA